MNKRQQKKKRKKIYKELIEDVALEISLDSKWRKKILELPVNVGIEISYTDPIEIPQFIQNEVIYHKLKFEVMKVKSCKECFDEGLVIFKFQSKEYPEIVRFSGNNPKIL